MNDDEKIWLDYCMTCTDMLTEYEANFIEDIYDKSIQDNPIELSDQQSMKLKHIYHKVCK